MSKTISELHADLTELIAQGIGEREVKLEVGGDGAIHHGRLTQVHASQAQIMREGCITLSSEDC